MKKKYLIINFIYICIKKYFHVVGVIFLLGQLSGMQTNFGLRTIFYFGGGKKKPDKPKETKPPGEC